MYFNQLLTFSVPAVFVCVRVCVYKCTEGGKEGGRLQWIEWTLVLRLNKWLMLLEVETKCSGKRRRGIPLAPWAVWLSYAPPDSLSILPMWSGPRSPVLSARVCALWLLPGLGLGMHLQGIDEEWEEHKDRPRSWAPSLPGSGLLGAVSLQGKPQLPLPWGWKASWELYLALLFLNPAMYL